MDKNGVLFKVNQSRCQHSGIRRFISTDYLSETLATSGLQAIFVTFGGNALAPLIEKSAAGAN